MPSIHVIPARPDHIGPIVANMREADVREARDLYNLSPQQVLHNAFLLSIMAWTIAPYGRPVAMFGVGSVSLVSNTGRPWLLATPELMNWRIAFAKHSRYYIQQMLYEFDSLENYVDARNTDSIPWLRWCGFNIDPAQPFGSNNVLAHRFYLERGCLCAE